MSSWSNFQFYAENKNPVPQKDDFPQKFLNSYYDEAISKLLLEKAEDYYLKKLKETPFLKLKCNLKRKKTLRRQILRANVHYKYNLQRKAFFSWSFAIIRRKQKVIAYKIIDLHYSFKIKCKYWLKLKHARKISALNNKIMDTKRKIVINSFLHINVTEMALSYNTLVTEYIIRMVGYNKLRKRKLAHYFQLWKLYQANVERKQKNKNLCKQFQKAKYNPEHLRAHFEIWQNYTQLSIIDKLKFKIAEQREKNKLQSSYLRKFQIYKNRRKAKTRSKYQAVEFHHRTLLIKGFNTWVKFKCESIRLNDLSMQAEEFYLRKLHSKSFIKLRNFVKQQNWIKQELLLLQTQLTFKLLKKYFIKLRKFHANYKLKLIQVKEAELMYNRHLTQRSLKSWQKYANERKSKILRRNEILAKSFAKKRLNLLQKCFAVWNIYRCKHQHKTLQIKIADLHVKYVSIRRAVTLWIIYIKRKQIVTSKINAIKCKFELTSKKHALSEWQIFVRNCKFLKREIIRAKEMHRKCLVQEGIRAIMTIAHRKEQWQQKSILSIMEKKLSLASKYFKLWKFKASINNKTVGIERPHHVGQVSLQVDSVQALQSNFQWNPVCFKEPRIPPYFKMLNRSLTDAQL